MVHMVSGAPRRGGEAQAEAQAGHGAAVEPTGEQRSRRSGVLRTALRRER